METEILAPDKATTQLRGEKLVKYLASWIRHIQTQARVDGTEYTLNVSQLSDLSGVTRKTITRQLHKVLSSVGTEVPARQLKRDGSKSVAELQKRLQSSIKKNDEIKQTIAVYRAHLLAIYNALATHPTSWNARDLVAACNLQFIDKNNQCPLCGSSDPVPLIKDVTSQNTEKMDTYSKNSQVSN